MTASGIETFRGISPAEFFYRNRQMAGFGNPTQALFTTIRELVENSLDSCEDAGVLPLIQIQISTESPTTCKITVSDNGTGVPDDKVPEAFARVLYGSKYSSRQRRGTFGLGVTMSVLYGQITTDSPALIHSRTAESGGTKFSLYIDVEKNTPIVESSYPQQRKQQGTTVSITLNADLKRARDRIVEYLRLTGISTPHAKISLNINEVEHMSFGGHIHTLPPFPTIALPHPRAADLELLRRLVASRIEMPLHDFLVESFQQLGHKTAERFLSFIHMDPKKTVGNLDRSELSYLSSSLRKYDEFGRPSSECLSPIGKDALHSAFGSEYKSTIVTYASRGPLEWDGFPYIIEGVLAVGDAFEKSDTPTLFRFANRVPLLYDTSDDVFTKVMKRVSWARYGIQESNQVALFMHFCSTRVPYSAAGKQSISSVGCIESEILAIYRDLGRRLKKISERKRRATQSQRRYREFSRTFKQLTKFSSDVAGAEVVPDTRKMVQDLFEVIGDV
ncbi:MAG: DNA topoisomerase VI subunit B [Candidatus Thorarchaeota archaeon]